MPEVLSVLGAAAGFIGTLALGVLVVVLLREARQSRELRGQRDGYQHLAASRKSTIDGLEKLRDQWIDEARSGDAQIAKMAEEIASLTTEKERIEALHAEVIANANTLRRQRDEARRSAEGWEKDAERYSKNATYWGEEYWSVKGLSEQALSEATENEQKWMEEARHKQDQLTILGNEFLGMADKRDEAVKEIELLRKNVSRSDRKAAKLEKELKKARKAEEATS